MGVLRWGDQPLPEWVVVSVVVVDDRGETQVLPPETAGSFQRGPSEHQVRIIAYKIEAQPIPYT